MSGNHRTGQSEDSRSRTAGTCSGRPCKDRNLSPYRTVRTLRAGVHFEHWRKIAIFRPPFNLTFNGKGIQDHPNDQPVADDIHDNGPNRRHLERQFSFDSGGSVPDRRSRSAAGPPAADTAALTTPAQRKGFIRRIIDYYSRSNVDRTFEKKIDWSIAPGPNYSSDVGFGLGFLVAGLYRLDRTDSVTAPSNISIYGNITTQKFLLLRFSGDTSSSTTNGV